ncbi:MAG: hypothetical protein HQK49_13650 [Oligoflexia bacterium]|nr:hypothetical protein [Oligoflexia bacterium]
MNRKIFNYYYDQKFPFFFSFFFPFFLLTIILSYFSFTSNTSATQENFVEINDQCKSTNNYLNQNKQIVSDDTANDIMKTLDKIMPVNCKKILYQLSKELIEAEKKHTPHDEITGGNVSNVSRLFSKENHVKKIYAEILTTEKAYNDQLSKLVKVFIDNKKSINKNIYYTTSDLQTITNITNAIIKIYDISSNFILYIESFIHNPTSIQNTTFFETKNIDDIVNNYSTYIINNPDLTEKISEKKYLKYIKSNLKFSDFTSLEINPVQRMPRYILLYKELLKNITQRDCPQIYETTVSIHKTFSEITDSINKKSAKAAVERLSTDLNKFDPLELTYFKKWGKIKKVYHAIDNEKDKSLAANNLYLLLKEHTDNGDPVTGKTLRKSFTKEEMKIILLSTDVKSTYNYYLINGEKNKNKNKTKSDANPRPKEDKNIKLLLDFNF